MNRTGTILLAVVIGTLQWAGTVWAQNPSDDAKRLVKENRKLKSQVAKLNAMIKKLQVVLKLNQEYLAQAKALAERAKAEAAQQQQQMLRMLVDGAGVAMPPNGNVAPQQNRIKRIPTPVTGKVAKVDSKDQTLVQLNIASNKGLKLGQKLEVFRTQPQKVYLGEIQIVELTETTAIGRHVYLPGRRLQPLQAGDVVTNDSSTLKKK